jgi:hypothetical protein
MNLYNLTMKTKVPFLLTLLTVNSLFSQTIESVFDKINIYPNPVTEILHIDNVALEKAFAYDILGHLVKKATFNSGLNNVFDLKGLPKGIYFLSLQAENTSTAKKIIVE